MSSSVSLEAWFGTLGRVKMLVGVEKRCWPTSMILQTTIYVVAQPTMASSRDVGGE